jgi:hypothetical protein
LSGQAENFKILNPHTNYEEFLVETWQKDEICKLLESETEFLYRKNSQEFENSSSDFTGKMNNQVDQKFLENFSKSFSIEKNDLNLPD